jgi:hypothetical protein
MSRDLALNVNRLAELLGKELGMFIDRKEVGAPNDFARMTDEELDAFLRESIEPCNCCTTGIQSPRFPAVVTLWSLD